LIITSNNYCIKSSFDFLVNLYNFTYIDAIIGSSDKIRSIFENEYPPVVCLEYMAVDTNIKSILCSGVLITQSHVLTVEHCITHLSYSILEVLVGPGELSQTVSYYPIWWISFNQWASTRRPNRIEAYNDIAILKVNYYIRK
jgi:V8-like Glu-specific endopeptidase